MLSHVMFLAAVSMVILATAIKLAVPSIKLWKHTTEQSDNALKKFEKAELNYAVEHSGLLGRYSRLVEFGSAEFHNISILLADPGQTEVGVAPKHFKVKSKSLVVGRGRRDFDKAVRLAMQFKATNSLSWVKVCPLYYRKQEKNEEILPVGATLAVLSNVYNTIFWCLTPVRVNFSQKKPLVHPSSKQLYSQVVYSTLEGHLLAGEERFKVLMLPKNNADSEAVLFEIASYARGAGFLGDIAFPIIQPLQNKFLNDNVQAMKRLMDEEV